MHFLVADAHAVGYACLRSRFVGDDADGVNVGYELEAGRLKETRGVR